MSAARILINRMIERLPDDSLEDLILILNRFQKLRKEPVFFDLENASSSSMDFWNNPIDDEIWNNV